MEHIRGNDNVSVKAALKEGRSAYDIAVLRCPKCGRWGYYNEGSHFYCRFCKQGFYCCGPEEDVPATRPYLFFDGRTTLADTVTETSDDYENKRI